MGCVSCCKNQSVCVCVCVHVLAFACLYACVCMFVCVCVHKHWGHGMALNEEETSPCLFQFPKKTAAVKLTVR